MKGSFRMEGANELAAVLRSLPLSVSRTIKKDALRDAAEPMVAVARRNAPREPGAPDLADNIEIGNPRAGTDTFGDEVASVSWGPVRGFFYAWFLEWGTTRMGARPFMVPAFDSQKERSAGIIQKSIWESIQSYVHSRVVQ